MDQIQESTSQKVSHYSSKIQHIPKSSIPQLSNALKQSTENSYEIFQHLMPMAHQCALAYLNLPPSQSTSESIAANSAIFLVNKGTAKLVGHDEFIINEGDIFIVPEDCLYSLRNISSETLNILQITFTKGNENNPESISNESHLSLADVLAYNQKRIEQYTKSRFFQMLDDGTLTDIRKREKYLGCIKVWSHYFQRVMLSRQVTSTDKAYHETFLQHLREEFGHDQLLSSDLPAIHDTILQATASWFVYKMFVLDNVGKTAVVHLVLETTADEFFYKAKPILGPYVSSNYFDLHEELDAGHVQLGVSLLQHEHPVTYARIIDLLENTWDMFETMLNRIVYIVDRTE